MQARVVLTKERLPILCRVCLDGGEEGWIHRANAYPVSGMANGSAGQRYGWPCRDRVREDAVIPATSSRAHQCTALSWYCSTTQALTVRCTSTFSLREATALPPRPVSIRQGHQFSNAPEVHLLQHLLVHPSFRRLESLVRAESGDGPVVLVLAPTRELAVQIQQECIKFGSSSRIKNT